MEQDYYPMGNKTLTVMLVKKSLAVFLFVPALVAGIFFIGVLPPNLVEPAGGIVGLYGLFLIFAFIAGILFSWVEYKRYGIFIHDKALSVQRGFLSIETVGIPYRRIKDVKIRRSVLDQFLSVSDIVITVLDADTPQAEAQYTLVLPAIHNMLALDIQDSLLKRAQVEQVDVVH